MNDKAFEIAALLAVAEPHEYEGLVAAIGDFLTRCDENLQQKLIDRLPRKRKKSHDPAQSSTDASEVNASDRDANPDQRHESADASQQSLDAAQRSPTASLESDAAQESPDAVPDDSDATQQISGAAHQTIDVVQGVPDAAQGSLDPEQEMIDIARAFFEQKKSEITQEDLVVIVTIVECIKKACVDAEDAFASRILPLRVIAPPSKNRQQTAIGTLKKAEAKGIVAEAERRLALVRIAYEIQLLDHVEPGVRARWGSLREFARLSGVKHSDVKNWRDRGKAYAKFLGRDNGMGLLLLLGSDSRLLWEKKMTSIKYDLLWQFCDQMVPSIEAAAKKMQPLACNLFKDKLVQDGIDPSELEEGDHLLSKHFRPAHGLLDQSLRGLSLLDTMQGDLLCLIYQFGPSGLPCALVDRGLAPQRRWNERGYQTECPPENTGVDERICLLREHLEDTVSKLREAGFIVRRDDNILSVTVDAATQLQLAQSANIAWWRKQASALVCHAFPRGSALEPDFRSVGSQFIRQLQHVCATLEDCHDRQEMASTLLSAAALPGAKDMEVQSMVSTLLDTVEFGHLHVLAARQRFESKNSRSTDDITADLEAVFVETIEKSMESNTANNERMNSHLGHLRAIWAKHLARYGSLKAAETAIFGWTPLSANTPSPLEQITLNWISLSRAMISRFRGHDSAESSFKALLPRASSMPRSFERQLRRQLWEVTAEEEYLRYEALSSSARQASIHIIQADREFREDKFALARNWYESALESDDMHTNDVVRAMVGVAKSEQALGWTAASIERWKAIKRVMDDAQWSKGFTYGLVDLSLGILEDEPRRIEEALSRLSREDDAMWLVDGMKWAFRVIVRYLSSTTGSQR